MMDVFLVGTDSGVGMASPVGCPRLAGGIIAVAAADNILADPFCFAI
jgi:hypothetical protein